MKEIIWNKDELKKINRIILSHANLKFDEKELSLITRNETPLTSLFNNLTEEIEELFYTKDRNKIKDVLIQASQVKADNNNPLHFGLVITLSKVDINDYTQIFEIFKQLSSQYARTISVEVKNVMKVINEKEPEEMKIEKLKLIIKDIKENENNTYINNIKNKLKIIFSYSNNIEKNDLFISTIKKLDSQVKEILIEYFHKELNTLNKKNEEEKNKDYYNYLREKKIKKLRNDKWTKSANPFINKH